MARLFYSRSGLTATNPKTVSLATVTSLTPATGSTAGGTAVTLTGTGFSSTAPATTVTIGGVAATSVVVVSATSLTCDTGAHAAGDTDVVVRNGPGPSNTLTNGFNYQSGGGGSILVTVTASGAAVPGGTVTLYNDDGTAIIGSGTPDASGQVTFSALDDGTYYPVLSPKFGYVLGTAEPDAASYSPTSANAVVVSGSQATQTITCQRPQYYDDFTDYSDSADLRNTYPDGVSTDPMDDVGQTFGTQHTMDLTGGASGGATSVVTWPSRPSSGCGADVTYRLAMRFNPLLSSATWFCFWRDYITTPWENGSTSCTGQWEYKWLLFHAGGSGAGYELLLKHGKSTGPNANLLMTLLATDGVGHSASGDVGLGSPSGTFPGTWHTHVLMVTSHGTASPTCTWYLDGTLRKTVTGASFALPGFTTNFDFVEFGANLDSGPDQVGQVRNLDRIMVSKTRPALSVL